MSMKRREFITLLGGAAVAWPLAARAQQGERVRRVGVLSNFAESDLEAQSMVEALHQTLQELGWVEGRNLRFDHRWAAGNSTRMGQVGDEAGADWIGNLNEHDWNGAGFFLEGGDCWGHVTNNYVRS